MVLAKYYNYQRFFEKVGLIGFLFLLVLFDNHTSDFPKFVQQLLFSLQGIFIFIYLFSNNLKERAR
jgi:hypothetical protein